MFAEETVYVNELCLTDVPDSERHTYSFDAHAVEHVENVLCCNISRWALSVRATSQASYCRIHHTHPHLQKHPQTHLRASAQVLSRNCSAVALFCSVPLVFFRLLGGKLRSRVSENEWAQRKDSSVLPPVGFNHRCNCTEHLACLRFLGLFAFYQHCCFIPRDYFCRHKGV